MVWREEVVACGKPVSDIDRPEKQDSQCREIEGGPCPELRESSQSLRSPVLGGNLPSLEKELLVRSGGTGKADGLTTKAASLPL